MKRINRFAIVFVVLALVFSIFQVSFAVDLPAGKDLNGQVVIVHTNDVHGHADDNMGYAGVGAVKKAYENAGASVLLLDAGDTFHGMPFATLSQGEDVVDIMNKLGYDAMTLGNHDFNYGQKQLSELIDKAEYPVLAANVLDEVTGKPAFQSNTVIEKGGIMFGIFGLVTPETMTAASPKCTEGLIFENPVETAIRQVEELKAQNVDYIIAITHLGIGFAGEFTSDKLSAAVPGIDIIIDGHSHTAMSEGQPVNSTIELVKQDALIASTGSHLENIGVIALDGDGNAVASLINGKEYTDRDEEIKNLIDEVNSKHSVMLEKVVGHTPVLLDGERKNVRTKETNLGDLVTDALRAATGADIAIVNGGGIRASIQAGDITQNDIITVFPFGNYVMTKEIDGAALLAALEHGVSFLPDEKGAFPHVSGMSYTLNPAMEPGKRISNVKIGNEDVSPDKVYTLVVDSFLGSGGDAYTMVGNLPITRTYGALVDILVEYLQTNPEIAAEPAGRINKLEDTSENVSVEKPVSEIKKDVPAVEWYIVVRGDCLWNIAKNQLSDPQRWQEIYKLNRDLITNPDLIYEGWKLKMPA